MEERTESFPQWIRIKNVLIRGGNMKIFYIDDNEAMAHTLIDEFNNKAREMKFVGDAEFIDINTYKDSSMLEFLEILYQMLSVKDNIVILDHNLEGFRFSKSGPIFGANIWKEIKINKPFSQIYILTSDEEQIERYRSESGVETIYDRDHLDNMIEHIFRIRQANDLKVDEWKNLVKSLKNPGFPSLTVARLESLIDEMEGNSLSENGGIVDETIHELIELAKKLIDKYEGDL